jgi:hypothetical protein
MDDTTGHATGHTTGAGPVGCYYKVLTGRVLSASLGRAGPCF